MQDLCSRCHEDVEMTINRRTNSSGSTVQETSVSVILAILGMCECCRISVLNVMEQLVEHIISTLRLCCLVFVRA